MCLSYNKEKTESLRISGEKEFYVYKYFKPSSLAYRWRSPYTWHDYDSLEWNESDRKSKDITEDELLKDSGEITHGIHVYLTIKDAKGSGWAALDCTLFRVKVLLEDLVA